MQSSPLKFRNLDSTVDASGDEYSLTLADGDGGDSARVVVIWIVGVFLLLVGQVVHHRNEGTCVRFLIAVKHSI